MKKNIYGITLIALVVTIVILLILSGITINSVLSENGLLSHVLNSKKQSKRSQLKEQVELALSEYNLEKAVNGDASLTSVVGQALNCEVISSGNSYYCFLDEYQVIFTEKDVTNIRKFDIHISHIYDSVADMKSSNDMSADQVVFTSGYWNETYGGSAYYLIEASATSDVDEFKCIQLDNGLYANLYPINNTVTVNQFGAYGDGIHDDSSSIQLALNSGFSNVKLESQKYKCCSTIMLSTPYLNFDGNNFTLFTDNDYKDTREWFFIVGANNVNIRNLKIESLENKVVGYSTQLSISECSNVIVDNCSFIVPDSSFGRNSGNIDLYTDWHNVTISNCELQLLHDSESGGCIWIRDLYKRGCSDLKFINNTCTKKSHDEILAIFSGSVENVTISGNKFIIEEGTASSSVMNFTLGSQTSNKSDNIVFSDNEIEAISSAGLFWITNATNLIINNNKIHYTKSSSSNSPAYVFRGISNYQDVTISNNNVTVDRDDNTSTQLYVMGISCTFSNNNITLNCTTDECFSGGSPIIGNTLTLNDTCKNIFNFVTGQCSNNTIISNAPLNCIFQWYNGTITNDIIINNNNIVYNTDDISKSSFSAINSVTLDNHKILFENNSISAPNLTKNARMLFLVLKDSTPQTVVFRNNTLGNYKDIYSNNAITHNIITENNN